MRFVPPAKLFPQNIEEDARLFVDRFAMMKALPLPPGACVAEIGVAKGNMSKFIINNHRPRLFVAVDAFKMHLAAPFWGKTASEHFNGMTHREFYEREMAQFTDTKVEAVEGWSHEAMATLPDDVFDMIYVDADHSEEGVRKDAAVSYDKIKSGGIMVFNDYTLQDPVLNVEYGVIQAANAFIVERKLKVIGFALNDWGFCDLAVRVRK